MKVTVTNESEKGISKERFFVVGKDTGALYLVRGSKDAGCALGFFPYSNDGEVQAAKAYDEAAKKYHREFANLNFKK